MGELSARSLHQACDILRPSHNTEDKRQISGVVGVPCLGMS